MPLGQGQGWNSGMAIKDTDGHKEETLHRVVVLKVRTKLNRIRSVAVVFTQ